MSLENILSVSRRYFNDINVSFRETVRHIARNPLTAASIFYFRENEALIRLHIWAGIKSGFWKGPSSIGWSGYILVFS